MPELDEPVPGEVGEVEDGEEEDDGEDGAVFAGGLEGVAGVVVVDREELPVPDLRSSEQPAATRARATAATGINVPFNFMLCSLRWLIALRRREAPLAHDRAGNIARRKAANCKG